MKDYRVVTISNRVPQEDYYTYSQFFKSLEGEDVLVLGQQAGEFTGLSDKPRILYNAIKAGLIPEKHIIFVDCWDVVFVEKPEVVLRRFDWFNAPVVIGAEKNCFPECFRKEFDRLSPPSSYKYPNSGVIVGETEAVLAILEAMDAPNLPVDYHDSRTGRNFHFNDQSYYMDIALRQPVKIELDYGCTIAQNMQDVTLGEISLDGFGVLNKETNTYPPIIHWNGSSKTQGTREPILKHLNML